MKDTRIATSVICGSAPRATAVVIAILDRLGHYDVEKVLRAVAAYYNFVVEKHES